MASNTINLNTYKAKALTSSQTALDVDNFLYINSADATTWTANALAATNSIAFIRADVSGAHATGHIMFLNVKSIGTPFQIAIHDSSEMYIWKRYVTSDTTYSDWIKMKAGTADAWTTARTFTVGATDKSVDGTANVSWSMNEIMGASDSTQFYRGDKTWSNTLGGVFTANGTITANGGYLKSTLNSNTVQIGSQNTSYCHITNSANIPFWFNKTVEVDGNIVLYNQNTSLEPHYLHLGGATNATMTSASTNPRICFSEGTNTQPVYLIYTDSDSYRAPAGLKVIGGASATPAWFEVEGDIYARALNLYPGEGSYREGIRIHSYSSWSDITLCGNDNTGASGTSANSWFLGNNNGNFYIARNGSPGSTAYLSCVNNVWNFLNQVTFGARVTSTAPSALTNVDRIVITPYYHTGGPWKITSRDDASNAYLSLYYSTTETARMQHNGALLLCNNISFTNSGTTFRGINYGTMGDNDQWRIGGAATAANAGYMELATADDGNEPIYVRQYTGVFTTLKRTLTLLDANGHTTIPGILYISQPAAQRNNGIVGTYDSTKAAAIWSMGDSFQIKADGTTLGSLYGAAYAHTNATGALGSRTLGGGHQFLWCQGGTVYAALGNNVWAYGIYISENNSPYLRLVNADVADITKANNGVTANRSSGIEFYSKGTSKWMGGLIQYYVNNNGQLQTYLYARNYKTDGTAVNNYIYLYANKDGTTSYAIANASAFRSAISAPSTTGGGASGTWGINITGSAGSVAWANTGHPSTFPPSSHDHARVGEAATWLYFNHSNEVNFGGTYNGNAIIYFGYRATDSRAKPDTYIFGTGNGTATVKAASFVGPLTGNVTGDVTGNCSGSSGSCTGNAATATSAGKWTTARNFTIKDSSSTNAGTATSVNGSGAVTLLLPATIKASITGNCSGSSGSCTGNAATATRINGNLSTVTTGNHNIWVSDKSTPDGVPKYVSNVYVDAENEAICAATIYASKGFDATPSTKGTIGQNMTGVALQVGRKSWANTGITNGNADGASLSGCNLFIRSWYGVGFVNSCPNGGHTGSNSITLAIDCRWGSIVYRGSLSQGSSRTMKKNIVPLKSYSTIIDQLQPVSFNYIDDPQVRMRTGLIYEDTYPILPEICLQTNGMKTISYVDLVPILLKEIQDLRKRVYKLEQLLKE